MCCRYTLRDPSIVLEQVLALGAKMGPTTIPQRFNAAPSQDLPAVIWTKDGGLCRSIRWGMVPFNARKDPKRLQLINARSELATEKPTFKQGVQKRRCVLPADGYFEWHRHPDGKTKSPFYVRRADGASFFLAGIYDEACEPFAAGFVVLTTISNDIIRPIHDCMPVILDLAEASAWLTPGPVSPIQVRTLCVSYPSALLRVDPVSPLVDNVRNDSPECVHRWRS